MSTEALLSANFKTKCYEHQLREFELRVDAPCKALAWSMRTGKSKAEIDRACHLYKRGLIDGVLIFAPNGVHANWIERELPIHMWDGVPHDGLVWRSVISGIKAVKRLPKAEHEAWHARQAQWWRQLATIKSNSRLMWLAINSESMTRPDVRKAVARFLKHRRVLAIFDESDDFGTPGSKRTKMARAMARHCLFRDILSGTMITGSPLAAFSQFELLEKGALGFDTYADFKAQYAVEETRNIRGRSFAKVVGYKNEDDLRKRMARLTSVVLREDCTDMPDLVPVLRKITPSPEQMEVYRELHRGYIVSIGKERVSVGERAARLGKLQQVFSGFVFDEFGQMKKIPGVNPRLEALSKEVYLAPGKVIIWCQFQPDIDFVVARLLADGHKVAEYHGRVSDKEKLNALTSFRENRSIKPLVGHAKSGGRGQDMSVASKIIWYSHTFSARLRQQAMERATKIGGKNIEVVDFEAPGPDAYIRSVVTKRINVADAIAGTGLRDFLEGLSL